MRHATHARTAGTARTGSTAATAASGPPTPGRRVVDAPTRMFHWLFAATFTGAYLSADSEHWRLLHATLGYAFGGLLVFRVLYGLLGPRHASLGSLWRRIAGAPAWLRSLGSARAESGVNRRQGQQLATTAAIVAMLALAAPLALSGWGAYADWGDLTGGDLLSELHEVLGEALLALVLAHLGLVAGLSVLRRRNLALPMLTGRVREPGPSPVRHDRRWLAALLLAAVAGFGAWQWLDAGGAPRAPPVDRDDAGAVETVRTAIAASRLR